MMTQSGLGRHGERATLLWCIDRPTVRRQCLDGRDGQQPPLLPVTHADRAGLRSKA